MSKYIDSEKLIALIDAKLEDLGLSGSVWVGRSVLQDLKGDIITSLQQEQPGVVDLEKEIIRYQREDMDRDTTVGDVARHFWNLALTQEKGE